MTIDRLCALDRSAQVAAGASYRIMEYAGEAGFFKLRPEWEALWSQSAEGTQFQNWHWQYLYWKCLAPNSEPLVLAAMDSDGKLVALAAFLVCRDQQSRLSKAAFVGDKRADYHQVLACPGLLETPGLMMLEHFISKFRNRVPFMEFNNVPAASWTGTVLQKLCGATKKSQLNGRQWETQAYSVALPATVDEYLEQIGTRSRRDFRYDRRRLAKEFSVEFRVCSSLGGLEECLDAIETIDRARWGTNSRYCLASHRDFERSVARAFSEMGIYRTFLLYLDGKAAAFVTCALVRGAAKVDAIGYDPSVGKGFSIGKILNFYAIEHCIRDGQTEYDLTRGSEDYKTWLGAKPNTNLHVRLYRSWLDRQLESGATALISHLVKQSWMRNLYQRFARR